MSEHRNVAKSLYKIGVIERYRESTLYSLEDPGAGMRRGCIRCEQSLDMYQITATWHRTLSSPATVVIMYKIYLPGASKICCHRDRSGSKKRSAHN